jgi:hypothetical protein
MGPAAPSFSLIHLLRAAKQKNLARQAGS